MNNSNVRILTRYSALVLLIFSLSVWVWQKLHDPNVFPLHNIKINGKMAHVNQNILRKTLLPLVKQGFFGIDIPKIKRHVEQLSWVARVEVQRQWPDTLVITLYEQKPVARFGDKDLLTANGELFAQGDQLLDHEIPVLTGPPGQHQIMLHLMKTMNEALKPFDLSVVHLQLSQRRAWTVELSNGTQVMLGRVDIMDRFKHYVQAYPKLQATPEARQQHLAAIYVDLRYSNGMAVKWQKSEGSNR